MKKTVFLFSLSFLCVFVSNAQVSIPHSMSEDNDGVMSSKYWELWNPEVQAKIDEDIDAYRKSDAEIEIPGLKKGTEVKVEQVSSDFIFGAHIFNFDQLGKKEYNDRYKELYGTLFNSATISFYWKKFETEPGRLRFAEEYWDTEQWWNNCENPKVQNHWRRPSTDKVVEFCKAKGIRLHGHPLIWGNRTWHYPEWLYGMVPDNEKAAYDRLCKNAKVADGVTVDSLEANLPGFGKIYNDQFKKRIERIAEHYKGEIDSWDVVNESATEWASNNQENDRVFMKSSYGLMPGDYTYKAFKTAENSFPANVKLNINDYFTDPSYVRQIKDLQSRGCKIDIMGSQMHLFNPKQCKDISEGADIMTPEILTKRFDLLSQANLPIHLSEITITSPMDGPKGEMIQAIIARNLYRKWFSIKNMMGITWWNVVDDCGAPGEPSVSGLFHRDMTPKTSYFALKQLILDEFRTNTIIKTTKKDVLSFRGFKGNYKISWTDKDGEHSQEFHLK